MSTLKLWIARDKDGELTVFEDKPYKDGNIWFNDTKHFAFIIYHKLFPEITFENSPKCVTLKLEENEVVYSKK